MDSIVEVSETGALQLPDEILGDSTKYPFCNCSRARSRCFVSRFFGAAFLDDRHAARTSRTISSMGANSSKWIESTGRSATAGEYLRLMTAYLLDTNILLRSSDSNSPWQPLADASVTQLLRQGNQLWITSQNIIEFWVVATRPINVNGLGWSIAQTCAEIEQILNQFPQLEETPQIFPHWFSLVTTYQLQGKRVHDARLVAVTLAHGITHLLTFNSDDFRNINEIRVIQPQAITVPPEN